MRAKGFVPQPIEIPNFFKIGSLTFYRLNPDLAQELIDGVTPQLEREYPEEYAAARAALA